MTAASILLGCAFGALSSALALVVRQEESIIGASQFVILPMTFLSSLFMAQLLLPDWMQSVAALQPGQLGGRVGARGTRVGPRLVARARRGSAGSSRSRSPAGGSRTGPSARISGRSDAANH